MSEQDDVLVLWCADGERAALTAHRPHIFTTAHYDGHPMVLVRFTAVEREELTELITESWRHRAPRRLVTLFDAALDTAAGPADAGPAGGQGHPLRVTAPRPAPAGRSRPRPGGRPRPR